MRVYCVCSALHDSLIGKLKSLDYQSGYAMSMDRHARLNASLLEDLQAISQLYVDGSVLKNTGIAKTIKTVTSAKSKLIASQCETLAAEIIQKWKEQVKNDNKVSTIRNMKGGKVIEMPAGDFIERPRCVAAGMWSVFERSYNKSQLFAIKFVSNQFEGGQDTRIALVQGSLFFRTDSHQSGAHFPNRCLHCALFSCRPTWHGQDFHGAGDGGGASKPSHRQ